jgi:hypothetical protein
MVRKIDGVIRKYFWKKYESLEDAPESVYQNAGTYSLTLIVSKEIFDFSAKQQKNFINVTPYNSNVIPFGDTSSCPEIRTNKPTGSGWIWVSAGTNHALALKTDGTLVGMGQ